MKGFSRVMSYARPYRLWLWLSFSFAGGGVLLGLLGPVLIGKAVDFAAAGNAGFGGLARTLLLFGAVMAASAFLQWLSAHAANKAAHKTVMDLRTAAFEKLQRVPLRYIDSTPRGDLINRIGNGVDQVCDGLIQGMAQLFGGVMTILGTLVFMLWLNPLITMVVVALTPLSFLLASAIAKRSYRMFQEQTRVQNEIGAFLEEMLGNQEQIKAAGYEERAEKRFDEMNRALYACGQPAQFYSSMTNPSTRFINGLVFAAAGVIGALSAIRGSMSVGEITSFLTYAGQYAKPFNEISAVVTQLQSALSAAAKLFELLDEREESGEADLGDMPPGRGEVRFADVDFSYNKKTPLIQGFSLKVSPGERVAIVGPTGSGKTTLINLLMRFYDVDGGGITIDGAELRSVKRSSLRRRFGMVLQDTWLYHATVRENIAYARPDASMEEVEAAAQAAYAHGFIKRLPQGYDTVITPDGGNLSQGQRQLLCIARVMLARPSMLILDEATSSIDTLTEVRVQRAFSDMMRGKTSFVVAHRLSTIREADVILVLEAGRIVEQGTHDELMRRGGFYARLSGAK